MTVPNLLKSEQILAVAKEFSFQSGEDLVAEIGFGKISATQVVGRLRPKLVDKEESPLGLVGKVVSRLTRPKVDAGIKVDGVSDMLLHFANCCQPLPGEKVLGFITRGNGVAIHNENCRHIKEADPDRLVGVSWEPSEKNSYPARLRVITVEGKGILADISAIFSLKDANIIQAEVKTTVDNKGIALFTIEVEDYAQLQDIIRSIKKVRHVLMVERLQDA